MKKFLIVFGYFLISIISIGTLFKLMHWPGAAPILVIGISFFSMFFLPIFFIQRMFETKTALNIIVNMLALFTTCMIFIGILFKVQHWPGAGPLLLLGTTLFVFPTMLLYVIQQLKENGKKFGEFWRTVVLSVIVSVFFFIFGLNYSKNILNSYIRIEDKVIQTNDNLDELNDFLLNEIEKKALLNPTEYKLYFDKALVISHSTNEMIDYIDNLKKTIISATDGKESEGTENHWKINSKDNYDIPTWILGTSRSETGIALLDNLNSYKDVLRGVNELQLQSKDTANDDLDKLINTNLSGNEFSNEEVTWQEEMFYKTPLVGSLAILTSIQNEVLNAEFKTLNLINIHMK